MDTGFRKTIGSAGKALVFAGLLLVAGCDSGIYTNYKILRQAPSVKRFLEPGARTIIFPVVAKRYDSLGQITLPRELESIIHLEQRQIPLISFERFLSAAEDSNVAPYVLEGINEFNENGVLRKRLIERYYQCSVLYEPKFILICRLDRGEYYRDLDYEYKKRIFITGRLYDIREAEEVLAFVASSFARDKYKETLPSTNELIAAALRTIAKNLPNDPTASVLLEKREDW
ncbi:MAG: hypothetical protein A2268_13955 [Candidatus Raymondbacteria bacterium RifOxyA12_full_50_37]|uniref:Lipoprotein n=1 Tax=Candidatus Raymondbacteria bacterium RIFOXYD12_FULL_49_13 TaxID=1817890 RepID=A0A1F7FKI6_UNCRA|nr:MAG: hypothetical protein A2268_13955 [Candidatus Raymondbacteria bacterium RifOxyA12_full_50_37]OGJ88183.1 MAG: hypothetical protein A2248_19295 [Candidatus Raymondbacteria bacterium RIFOXYA2_FULL_49_16]OGJ98124.1 MAG: hypothetical protein A2350_00165 [Candidatus Raymondbacteria bacterium RifOxyB12_full_50_8]OGK01841.1 MAG: hypothetical protein A2487_14340 [Candidatus Raymondbacteria bacterium RifOxyC12_full_50_8]OGK07229.1 MAG: hypothetical protein A2519_13960 [Candidatus Raymondbacteria b